VVDSSGGYACNFVTNYCSAAWTSAKGDLTCPGTQGDGDGFMVSIASPQFETGHTDDEPALWEQPNVGDTVWISGEYPSVAIQDGHHFTTIIGCIYEYQDCNVTIQLGYEINGGPLQSLGSWDQKYDGQVELIDIDLSRLAGLSANFVFTVLAKNNSDDNAAFWFMPVIDS
jgi:hypothetical protein